MEYNAIDEDIPAKEPTTTHHFTPRTTPNRDHEIKHDDPKVKGSRWNDEHPTKSYVTGLQNEDFWALIRRFTNKFSELKELASNPCHALI